MSNNCFLCCSWQKFSRLRLIWPRSSTRLVRRMKPRRSPSLMSDLSKCKETATARRCSTTLKICFLTTNSSSPNGATTQVSNLQLSQSISFRHVRVQDLFTQPEYDLSYKYSPKFKILAQGYSNFKHLGCCLSFYVLLN